MICIFGVKYLNIEISNVASFFSHSKYVVDSNVLQARYIYVWEHLLVEHNGNLLITTVLQYIHRVLLTIGSLWY